MMNLSIVKPVLTINHDSCAAALKSMLVAVATVFAIGSCNAGCAEFREPRTPEEDLERNYTAEVVACAAMAGYPGAYDRGADMRCRSEVDCRYGLGPCQ